MMEGWLPVCGCYVAVALPWPWERVSSPTCHLKCRQWLTGHDGKDKGFATTILMLTLAYLLAEYIKLSERHTVTLLEIGRLRDGSDLENQ